jgi:hypothetical protein
MGGSSARVFWLSWIGFAVFFLLLQYVFNDAVGLFAVTASVIGAVPVAAIIYYGQKRKQQQG